MEAHSANILRKSGRGASWEGGYVRAGAGQVEGWVPVRPARMASRWWGAASFPGTGCGGVSGAGRGSGCAASPGGGCRVADRGLGPVCSWSRQGVGMSGVGRCAADRRCRVVGQQGGCRVGAGRCGPLGAARAGVDSLFRRGRHGAAAVSERGRSHPPRTEPLFRRGASLPAGPASGRCGPLGATRVGVDPLFRRGRHGAAAVSGRAGRIPRTQGLPSSRAAPSGRGPMLRFRTLFVLFCSVPPRRNRRRLQIRGFAAREKRKKLFFIFTL